MQALTGRFWSVGLARRPWLVTAVAVAVCAGFAARAATALVEAHTATAPPPSPPAPRRPPPPPVRDRPDGDQLVDRNMFCSACRPGAAPADAAAGSAAGRATLIATGIGRDPSATLVVAATAVQGAWGVGDAIPGIGRVTRIAPTWIELVDAGGGRARLSLRDAAADRGPDTAMPGPRSAAWAERIRPIDEQTYEIERSLIRELASGATRPGGVRPVPVFEHGALLGIRLVGVAADSVAAALKLRTGDTLTAIDGAPIKSLQQLLDLYAGLEQRSSLEISGVRAGQPLVRVLRLR